MAGTNVFVVTLSRLAGLGALTLLALIASAAPARGEAWLAPEPVSLAGDVGDAQVLLGADGATTAVWSEGDALKSALRPPGEDWEPAETLSADAGAVSLASSRDGDVLALYCETVGSGCRPRARVRRAGEGWGTSAPISSADLGPASDAVLYSAWAWDFPFAVWRASDHTLHAAYLTTTGWTEPPPGPGYTVTANMAVSAGEGGYGVEVLIFEGSGQGLQAWTVTSGFLSGTSGFADFGHSVRHLTAAAMPSRFGTTAAMVLYEVAQDDGSNALRSRIVPAGGTYRGLGEARDIATGGAAITHPPTFVVDRNGTATAAWGQGTPARVYAAQLPSEATAWSVPVPLSTAGVAAGPPSLAVDEGGSVVAAWPQGGGTVMSRRPAGESAPWSAASPVPGVGALTATDLSFDGYGNGALAGLTGTPPASRVAVAGFDGEPPQLLEAGASPATAFAGDPVAFDADVIDVWSPFTLQWDFGDGASAAGTPVVHAFGAPSTYSVRLTATDTAGNAESGAAPYTITARPTPTPTPAAATRTPMPQATPATSGPARPRTKATTLRALQRRGLAFSQRFRSAGTATWTLELPAGRGRTGSVLGRATRRIATAATTDVKLRLSRKGGRVAALRRPKRLVLRTVFTPATGGPPLVIAVTVTVRR